MYINLSLCSCMLNYVFFTTTSIQEIERKKLNQEKGLKDLPLWILKISLHTKRKIYWIHVKKSFEYTSKKQIKHINLGCPSFRLASINLSFFFLSHVHPVPSLHSCSFKLNQSFTHKRLTKRNTLSPRCFHAEKKFILHVHPLLYLFPSFI